MIWSEWDKGRDNSISFSSCTIAVAPRPLGYTWCIEFKVFPVRLRRLVLPLSDRGHTRCKLCLTFCLIIHSKVLSQRHSPTKETYKLNTFSMSGLLLAVNHLLLILQSCGNSTCLQVKSASINVFIL